MANTTNFGWETPDDTDLVKDGALAMRTLGNSIDTSFVDLKGGTTGQNLRKNSNTDLDFTWAGDATNTVIDAAGDLLVGTAADTLGRLAIGTAGQVLKVNSGATALEWGSASTAFSGCSVWNSGNQTHTNGGDLTVLFNSEFFDTDSYHSTTTNTARLTIPSGRSGKYLVSCVVGWSANANGARVIQILKNGTTQIARASTAGVANEGIYLVLSGVFDLAAADYVSLQVYQNSGNSLDVLGGNAQTLFSIVYLGA